MKYTHRDKHTHTHTFSKIHYFELRERKDLKNFNLEFPHLLDVNGNIKNIQMFVQIILSKVAFN